MMKQIESMIEDEVNHRLNEKITTFVEFVSKTYDISLKILLRDLANMDGIKTVEKEIPSQCLGVKPNGSRCTHSTNHKSTNGMCGKHRNQAKPFKPKPVNLPLTPRCQPCSSISEKLLIEI